AVRAQERPDDLFDFIAIVSELLFRHTDTVHRKRKQVSDSEQAFESFSFRPQISRRRDERRLDDARLELRNARRAASGRAILNITSRVEVEMRRGQARKNIYQRAERTNSDFFAFQIGKFLDAGMCDDYVIRPLDQNSCDL